LCNFLVFLHLLEGEAQCGTQLFLAHCKHYTYDGHVYFAARSYRGTAEPRPWSNLQLQRRAACGRGSRSRARARRGRAYRSSPPLLSSRHLGERGKHGASLAFLAYLYVGQRFGQQRVEHVAHHPFQHRLSDRLALKGAVAGGRPVAVVKLVDG
jgi:hypothetical protein